MWCRWPRTSRSWRASARTSGASRCALWRASGAQTPRAAHSSVIHSLLSALCPPVLQMVGWNRGVACEYTTNTRTSELRRWRARLVRAGSPWATRARRSRSRAQASRSTTRSHSTTSALRCANAQPVKRSTLNTGASTAHTAASTLHNTSQCNHRRIRVVTAYSTTVRCTAYEYEL